MFSLPIRNCGGNTEYLSDLQSHVKNPVTVQTSKCHWFYIFSLVQTYSNTHSGLTPQQWEGAVLQLHHDSVQHRQHGGDVQQDQDDWLKNTFTLFIYRRRFNKQRGNVHRAVGTWKQTADHSLKTTSKETLQGPVLLSENPVSQAFWNCLKGFRQTSRGRHYGSRGRFFTFFLSISHGSASMM